LWVFTFFADFEIWGALWGYIRIYNVDG